MTRTKTLVATPDPDSNKPLYTLSITSGSANLSMWTPVTDYIGKDGQNLYIYNDDKPGEPPTGSDDHWAPFKGKLVSVVPEAPKELPTPLSVPEQSVNGANGCPFVGTVIAIGGAGPYTFTLTGLPDGIACDNDGNLTGMPDALPQFTNVAVDVIDSTGTPASGVITLIIGG